MQRVERLGLRSRSFDVGNGMRAYLVQTSGVIEPFGEHPRESLILNRPLAWWQQKALTTVGVTIQPLSDVSQINDPNEHLIVEDRLYFTPELLREFITRSRQLGQSTQCTLKRGATTVRTDINTQGVVIHPDRVEYELRYVPPAGRRGESRQVIIDPDQIIEQAPLPRQATADTVWQISITDCVLMRIDHWVSILMANQAASLADSARVLKTLRSPAAVKFLPVVLRARSVNKWSLLSKFNKIGRNCDIHPTAYLEGCTIGDNVMIGAGSVLRWSTVGSRSNIANNSTVLFSVVGEDCLIANGAVAQFSVMYPCALASNLLSASLVGREALIAAYVGTTDVRLDFKPVVVVKHGKLVDTQQPVLGSCFGHGAQIGAFSIVAPGRTVPNGWQIAPHEDRVLRSFPAEGEIPGYRIKRPS